MLRYIPREYSPRPMWIPFCLKGSNYGRAKFDVRKLPCIRISSSVRDC